MREALHARCHLCILIRRSILNHKASRDGDSVNPDIVPLEVELTKTSFGHGGFEVGGWGVIMNIRGAREGNTKEKLYAGMLFLLHHKSEVINEFGDKVHPAQSFLHTSSSAHAELARYWLDQCSAKHVKCRESRSDHIPTRLLCLDSADDTGCVRLYKTSCEDAGLGYCTLSHCWGGANDILTLTTQNISSLSNSIKIEHLPRTFRDAITVTKTLGLDYLWIDSLCIIQDSPDDWSREAAAMGTIYENATCTISATVGRDPHAGCFAKRDPLAFLPCKLAGAPGDTVSAYGHESYQTDKDEISIVKHTHLYTRGWVMQERLLSARILYFTSFGIFWACRVGDASESNYDGRGVQASERSHFDGRMKPIFGNFVDSLEEHDDGTFNFSQTYAEKAIKYSRQLDAWDVNSPVRFSDFWFGIVGEYTECGLSKGEDKLIAISAIAQKIGIVSGFRYLAGLWEQTLEFDLKWYVRGEVQPRPSPYRAPTWTWASIEGPVDRWSSHEGRESMVDIISIEISTHSTDLRQTGQILGGSLTLHGFLRVLHWQFAEGWDPWNECWIHDGGDWRFIPDVALTPELNGSIMFLPFRHFLEDCYTRRILYGLAVIKVPESDYYERVGLIIFRGPRDTFNTDWLTALQKQNIVIK
jgi:hypothetical protein